MVRNAVLDDYKAIHEISKVLGYKSVEEVITKERLKHLITQKDQLVIVYVQDECVLGWLHCTLMHNLASESFYEIVGLAVCEDKQGKGIGTALVEHALALSNQTGVKIRVRCSTAREKSNQFYIKANFNKIKTQNIYEYLPK